MHYIRNARSSNLLYPTVNVYDNFYVSVTWLKGQEALQEVRVFRAIGLGIVTKQHPFDRGCDRTFRLCSLMVERWISNPLITVQFCSKAYFLTLIISMTNKERRKRFEEDMKMITLKYILLKIGAAVILIALGCAAISFFTFLI